MFWVTSKLQALASDEVRHFEICRHDFNIFQATVDKQPRLNASQDDQPKSDDEQNTPEEKQASEEAVSANDSPNTQAVGTDEAVAPSMWSFLENTASYVSEFSSEVYDASKAAIDESGVVGRYQTAATVGMTTVSDTVGTALTKEAVLENSQVHLPTRKSSSFIPTLLFLVLTIACHAPLKL